jgi:RimJ/RimL family protein N-acetyltransferase
MAELTAGPIRLRGFSDPDQVRLARLYSGVFEFNAASRRVLEKSGFKLEGVFEKSIIKNVKIGDEYRYCKLNHSPDHK